MVVGITASPVGLLRQTATNAGRVGKHAERRLIVWAEPPHAHLGPPAETELLFLAWSHCMFSIKNLWQTLSRSHDAVAAAGEARLFKKERKKKFTFRPKSKLVQRFLRTPKTHCSHRS